MMTARGLGLLAEVFLRGMVFVEDEAVSTWDLAEPGAPCTFFLITHHRGYRIPPAIRRRDHPGVGSGV